jgi:hypothetical protein
VETAAHVPFSGLRNTTISTGMTRGDSQASNDMQICRVSLHMMTRGTWLLQRRVVRFDKDPVSDLSGCDKWYTSCMSRHAAMLTTTDMGQGQGATCIPRFGGLSSKLPGLSILATCSTRK